MPLNKITIAFGTTMTTQMMMPKAFAVGNNMYYYADELKTFCPKFFVGTSKTIRVIIERKNIPENEYIYAIKNEAEWNILDATSKKAKLLIGKNWVDTFFTIDEPKAVKAKVVKAKVVKAKIPATGVVIAEGVIENNVVVVNNVNNDDEDVENTMEDVEDAPPIFELNEEEKFKDVDGNVIEIETRGERHVEKIYFNMVDVSIAFGMPNLKQSLLHKTSGYERNVDYKLLNLTGFTNGKITNKPRLYLTYNGFLKVINVSRDSLFSNTNIKIVYKWLANILNYKKSINNTLVRVNKNTSGLIYIVSSPLIGIVKIGYWTGGENGLYSRYRMVYGQDVILHHKYVADVRDVEKEFHNYFNEYKISGELFEKDKLELYIEYLNNELVETERTVDDVINENNEVVVNVVNSDDDVENTMEDVEGNDVIEIETRGYESNIDYKLLNLKGSVMIKELEEKYENELLTHQIEIQKKDAEMKDKDVEILKEKHEKEILLLRMQLYTNGIPTTDIV